MRELLRIGAMCVHDLLEEHFDLPLLKGALALDAVLGTNLGPRSPGTVMSLLYRGRGHARRRGAATAARRARRAVRGPGRGGARRRASRSVPARRWQRISVREDRAAGVVLASGEEIAAGTVVSNADPKTTFLKLLGSEHLDAGFVRRVAQLRARGVAAKLHLALERLPEFPGLDAAALRGRLLVAPSSDYIERAYNHSKYGEFSAAPMLEITVPSVARPGPGAAGCARACR